MRTSRRVLCVHGTARSPIIFTMSALTAFTRADFVRLSRPVHAKTPAAARHTVSKERDLPDSEASQMRKLIKLVSESRGSTTVEHRCSPAHSFSSRAKVACRHAEHHAERHTGRLVNYIEFSSLPDRRVGRRAGRPRNGT